MPTANCLETLTPLMRLVRDQSGRAHVVSARDGDHLDIVDPATGRERTVPATDVDPVVDEPELPVLAAALPTDPGSPLDGIGDPRAVGLLGVLEAAGPLPATMLLAFESLCESDLHGIVGELSAAGYVEQTTVDGRSGYRTTAAAERTLAGLRD